MMLINSVLCKQHALAADCLKLATLVHKCLTGRAPAYLAEYCRQAGTRCPGMRSAGTSMLDVPRMHYAPDHLLSPANVSGTACQLASGCDL